MRELLSDLVAEQQALDQSLQRINIREWRTTTPSGLTVHETVSHLSAAEEFASMSFVEGGTKAALNGGSVEQYLADGVRRGSEIRPQDAIEWWRAERAKVVEGLSRLSGDDRVEWLGQEVSASAFACARLADTWAHGLDALTALQKPIEDSPRLRHIAWLGYETLPNAFANAGVTPNGDLRVEVFGPMYAKWVFGSADATNLVKAPAGEWCRKLVEREKLGDTGGIHAEGPVAEEALRVARIAL